MKLSVTHRGNLKKKYGDAGLTAIDGALAAWRQGNQQLGFATVHIAVDEASDLAPHGIAPVSGKATAIKIKRVIDQLCARLNPDYLVIIGSADVVPHFEVANPTLNAEADKDTSVPTDNPYACSRTFRAGDRATYLVPDRVLGRLPDLPGASDPAVLVELLTIAANWQSRPGTAYADDLLACCKQWSVSGEACVRALGRSVAGLEISPPSIAGSTQLSSRHSHLLHMIKAHGLPLDPRFFGQDGPLDFPELITPTSLAATIRSGTVAGAMCCFGASLFDPHDPLNQLPGQLPIALSYLLQGAFGFGGSTNTAWVGIADLQGADWIVTGFLKNVLGGASLGRALLDAKQNFVDWIQKQGRSLDLFEEKTLLQFLLLGDPAIHPVAPALDATPAPAGGIAAAGLALAARAGAGGSGERSARRASRLNLGAMLRSALPERQQVAAGDGLWPTPANAARMIDAAVLKADRDGGNSRGSFDFQPSMVQRVAAKVPVVAVLGGRVAAAARQSADRGPREVLEYYWTARQGDGRFTEIRMIQVTADKDGNVLRSKMVASC